MVTPRFLVAGASEVISKSLTFEEVLAAKLGEKAYFHELQ